MQADSLLPEPPEKYGLPLHFKNTNGRIHSMKPSEGRKRGVDFWLLSCQFSAHTCRFAFAETRLGLASTLTLCRRLHLVVGWWFFLFVCLHFRSVACWSARRRSSPIPLSDITLYTSASRSESGWGTGIAASDLPSLSVLLS